MGAIPLKFQQKRIESNGKMNPKWIVIVEWNQSTNLFLLLLHTKKRKENEKSIEHIHTVFDWFRFHGHFWFVFHFSVSALTNRE